VPGLRLVMTGLDTVLKQHEVIAIGSQRSSVLTTRISCLPK
jgi:hypothetical protein